MEPYPPCNSGNIFTKEDHFNTYCHKCMDGFFKEEKATNTDPCLPCNHTVCRVNYEILAPCNKTHAVECGPNCMEGYYKVDWEKCVPCCQCIGPNDDKESQCIQYPGKSAPVSSIQKSIAVSRSNHFHPVKVTTTSGTGSTSTISPSATSFVKSSTIIEPSPQTAGPQKPGPQKPGPQTPGPQKPGPKSGSPDGAWYAIILAAIVTVIRLICLAIISCRKCGEQEGNNNLASDQAGRSYSLVPMNEQPAGSVQAHNADGATPTGPPPAAGSVQAHNADGATPTGPPPAAGSVQAHNADGATPTGPPPAAGSVQAHNADGATPTGPPPAAGSGQTHNANGAMPTGPPPAAGSVQAHNADGATPTGPPPAAGNVQAHNADGATPTGPPPAAGSGQTHNANGATPTGPPPVAGSGQTHNAIGATPTGPPPAAGSGQTHNAIGPTPTGPPPAAGSGQTHNANGAMPTGPPPAAEPRPTWNTLKNMENISCIVGCNKPLNGNLYSGNAQLEACISELNFNSEDLKKIYNYFRDPKDRTPFTSMSSLLDKLSTLRPKATVGQFVYVMKDLMRNDVVMNIHEQLHPQTNIVNNPWSATPE
eukprot:gene5904-6589_t